MITDTEFDELIAKTFDTQTAYKIGEYIGKLRDIKNNDNSATDDYTMSLEEIKHYLGKNFNDLGI